MNPSYPLFESTVVTFRGLDVVTSGNDPAYKYILLRLISKYACVDSRTAKDVPLCQM